MNTLATAKIPLKTQSSQTTVCGFTKTWRLSMTRTATSPSGFGVTKLRVRTAMRLSAGMLTTRYAYDALGRRVSKLDSFGATHYLWDGDLMVHSQRGSKEALFVFEPNSFVPLATVQGTKTDRQTYC
jgi:YD repeat-containing protein